MTAQNKTLSWADKREGTGSVPESSLKAVVRLGDYSRCSEAPLIHYSLEPKADHVIRYRTKIEFHKSSVEQRGCCSHENIVKEYSNYVL